MQAILSEQEYEEYLRLKRALASEVNARVDQSAAAMFRVLAKLREVSQSRRSINLEDLVYSLERGLKEDIEKIKMK